MDIKDVTSLSDLTDEHNLEIDQAHDAVDEDVITDLINNGSATITLFKEDDGGDEEETKIKLTLHAEIVK